MMEEGKTGVKDYVKRYGSGIITEVLQRRFYVFVCGMILNIVAGTQYGFSLYSPAMKTRFGWNQDEVSTVGIAGNLGLYIGFPIGFFYDWAGPRITSGLSGLLAGTGLFLTYLALQGHVPHPYILICFFYFFIGQGCWGLYEVGVLTNIKNYSSSPNLGLVTGLLVSAFGIASAIYSGIYAAFGSDNVQNFILFMFIIIVIASVLAAIVIIIIPKPVSLPLHLDDNDNNKRTEEAKEAAAVVTPPSSKYTNEATGWRLLLRYDFYLLWSLFAIGAGAGLLVINQLGEIVFSLTDGDENMKNIMVAVFSIANCVGRIGSGLISDKFESRINRTVWILLVLGITCVSHGVFGVYQNQYVLLPVVLASGLGYGGLFALIPVLIGKFWGTKERRSQFWVYFISSSCGQLNSEQVCRIRV